MWPLSLIRYKAGIKIVRTLIGKWMTFARNNLMSTFLLCGLSVCFFMQAWSVVVCSMWHLVCFNKPLSSHEKPVHKQSQTNTGAPFHTHTHTHPLMYRTRHLRVNKAHKPSRYLSNFLAFLSLAIILCFRSFSGFISLAIWWVNHPVSPWIQESHVLFFYSFSSAFEPLSLRTSMRLKHSQILCKQVKVVCCVSQWKLTF